MLGKRKKKVDIKLLTLISIVIGLIIVYINFIFFIETPQIYTTLNFVAAIIALGIPLLFRYIKQSKLKKIESIFPRFLADVTENINTGMTLPQAIRACSRGDYGPLTPYVKDINAKISWGITFERVLNDFAEKINSKNIKRTSQTIVEAHKSGGAINTVLEAVAESMHEIEKIRKERSANVYSQMMNGYLIYIVFLGVMIGISVFLLPTFSFGMEGGEDFGGVFEEIFQSLIIIQGVFAGLSIGKMAEGTLTAGVKHSLALTIVGYSALVLFM